ncbi:MAG: glycosyltransferase family 39 protein [Chloroflexota bacterium]
MSGLRSWRTAALVVLCILLLGGVVLILNLPWSPAFEGLGPDSGVYAYIGSAIVDGQVPYRDVWEHKPPIGFYLDALAVLLLGQNPWAIWWLNLTWIALSATAFLLIIRKMMGLLTGFIASLVFVLGVMFPEIFQGGNLLEIYALLPQVLTIGVAYTFFSTRQDRWILLFGLLTGIGFMTKQTTIALGGSALLTVILVAAFQREFKSLWRRVFYFGAGFLIPLGIAILYWTSVGGLDEFLAGVFLYNFAYVGVGAPFLWSIKNTFLNVFPKMFISKLYYIASLSFIVFLADNFYRFQNHYLPRRESNSSPASANPPAVELTILTAYLALPIELVFTSLGGRNFGHYFLTILPAVTTVTAYVIWKNLVPHRDLAPGTRGRKPLRLGWLFLGVGVLVWSLGALQTVLPTGEHLASLPNITSQDYELSDIEKYILSRTEPDDRVLVWHVHLSMNFNTDRRPPQRILFPAELFIPVGRAKNNLDDFLEELEANPAALIIVQENSSLGLPFVDVPVEEMCPNDACMPELAAGLHRSGVLEALERFRQYFLDNYTFDAQIHDWIVYRLVH